MDNTLLSQIKSLGYKDPGQIDSVIREVNDYFSRLKPELVDYEQSDNVTTKRVALIGQLPIISLGKHVGLRVWFPLGWPELAPILHIMTNPDSFVNPAGLVDTNGRVQHNYLKQWTKDANLVDFLQSLIIEFTETLPVFDLQNFNLPSKVRDNILDIMRHYPDLTPSLAQYESEDGVKSEQLKLEGLLPVDGNFGTFFHVPLRIWIFHDFPQVAPIVFVISRENVTTRQTRSLYQSGRVKHRSLREWKYPESSLDELVQHLILEFSECPPIQIEGLQLSQRRDQKQRVRQQLEPQASRGNPNTRVSGPSKDTRAPDNQYSRVRGQSNSPDNPVLATRVKKRYGNEMFVHDPASTIVKTPVHDPASTIVKTPVQTGPASKPPTPIKHTLKSSSHDLDDVLGFVASAKLSEETATCLLDHGFTSLRAILCMQVDDLHKLGLPMGEFCILRESLRQLKRARRQGYDNVEFTPGEGIKIVDSSSPDLVTRSPSSATTVLSSSDDGDVLRRVPPVIFWNF